MHKVSYLTRINRLIQFVFHVIHGMWVVRFHFPRMSEQAKLQKTQRWSQQLASKLGLRVHVFGTATPLHPANCILIANHISWFDIFAINSITVARFVARADVQHWPVIGMLCKGASTVFIDRERVRDTQRVNASISTALNNQECIAFFPEGTTSNGQEIRPFKASLIQSAFETNATIQPIYLRYTNEQGEYSTDAAYIDDMSITDSLWLIASSRKLHIEIHFLDQLTPEGHDRRTLNKEIEAMIRAKHDSLMGVATLQRQASTLGIDEAVASAN
ncbi:MULTISPECIES: lysophospholipid acyltransferase family protein [Deefgea]|uniref:1-acyl-sn-glycerol-3-phosphate acyltransferase n=1 Tax=Deefgea chitinilytica TaxID=570276 RepID=A0ABS2CDF0_9NEIS|nr:MULTISPECIES: lysophospholipid acyltransferase family protein [Deefgea]MBM5572082.1 1-acyl-sn-glycerol-3-phosphate acyltransferase [Deefgea chitinilytica]MBM9889317.1 1-acyl-sn-glycerol-3-phosphate acyltransferase [Deefgea sp. CFH1-16]